MNKFLIRLTFICLVIIPINSYAWKGMPTPPLHVDGKYLKDPKGNIVLLHGLHMTPNPWFNGCNHGTCRWNNYDVTGCLNYFKSFLKVVTDTNSGWYCNLLRLHMDKYWSDANCTQQNPCAENEFAHFDLTRFEKYLDEVFIPIIEYAQTRGMYVILRPPGVCPDVIGANDAHFDYLMTIWDVVSSHPKIKNADNVMFELANEPINIRLGNGSVGQNSQAHFDVLKAIFQPIVNTIRFNGANNIIWIPGSGYQSQYSGYAINPVEGENIGYAVHIYPGYWGQDNNDPEIFRANWEKHIKPVADFAPIAVTEIDWAPEGYDSWGKGTTGKAGEWGFGANFKALADESGNVSWNVLGPENLIHQGDPLGEIAYNSDPEACAYAVYNWFKEYAKSNVPQYSSVTGLAETEFELYPNPLGEGNLILNVPPMPNSAIKLEIFSISGSLLYTKINLIEGPNNIAYQLSKGLYIVKIISGAAQYNKKLVVN